MCGWFVTGTDTGVGKTVVAATLARWCRHRGYRVGVSKPVATGVRDGVIGDDTLALLRAAELPLDWSERVTPFAYAEPAAPTVAARLAGRQLEFAAVINSVRGWRDWAEWLVVEGIGGLLCPLTERHTVADLAMALGLPLLIVARTTLGTLNHTLLTVEAAQRRRLFIAGIVLNEATPPSGTWAERTCAEELGRRLDVPILATIPHSADPWSAAWQSLKQVPWHELAGTAIVSQDN